MPRSRVQFTESALADLDSMLGWYSQQGARGVGERLVRRVFGRVDMLRNYPDMGRMVPEFGQSFIRELIEPPFRIVYRRDDPGLVSVVRIWRGERRLTLPDPSIR